jgi:L-serine dehydratase
LTRASILNNVIGPVMPGSSSSHTAGPYRIARLFAEMSGGTPGEVTFTFEPGSSIAVTYSSQGSDLALIMGILGLEITDRRFKDAFALAEERGVKVSFKSESFKEACHPNSVKIEAPDGRGGTFSAVADSVGGGAILFRYLNGRPVEITGDLHFIFASAEESAADSVETLLNEYGEARAERDGGVVRLSVSGASAPSAVLLESLRELCGEEFIYAPPVLYALSGDRIFESAAEMLELCAKEGLSMGEAALEYESRLLSLSKDELNREMDARLRVMLDSVALGLSEDSPPMQLLQNRAREVMRAEREGRVAVGGIHTRAAARAMAAMEVNSGRGIICAAPTAGSAGVLPGVMATLIEDAGISREKAVAAMWAAGAAGLILATRGTFAAEVCGCQVEIGAAGAMAASAVVEAAGGSAQMAADAASIMFQNAMGLVCDLVQETVEIPCHTRNGSFASQSFICADMAMGGYINPISLDDAVDAVYATGRMLPEELRCTSLGGIAVTESARAIRKNKI